MASALIFGISGQDGAYLARLLLQKGYRVFGTSRQSPDSSFPGLDALGVRDSVSRIQFDGSDLQETRVLLQSVAPQEIYHLAAPSQVAQSFSQPFETFTGLPRPVFTLLEALRLNGETSRLCVAGSAECFGSISGRASEETEFRPQSPYGIAKTFAHQITAAYRGLYGLHASTAILFNHESPLRGDAFATRKISRAAAAARNGGTLRLGNLEGRRDWGHAADYVEGMWRMLQQQQAADYVLATGTLHSVRDFVEQAFSCVDIALHWNGSGMAERGLDAKTGVTRVEIDAALFRPVDSPALCGDPSKAEAVLGWRRQYDFGMLVREMVIADRAV